MYKNRLAIIIFWSFIYLYSITIFSQPTLRHQNKKQKTLSDSTKYPIFFEKVYLHTDKKCYTFGETIWFKAYLVNGRNNYLTTSSNTLYVELISQDSKIYSRLILRLNNGMGKGDFLLSDVIPEGKYKIRAYTNWMKNFEEKFFFEKEVEVIGTEGSNVKFSSVGSELDKIDFFPEGGSLVEGITSIVAYKAVDLFGKSCSAEGHIVSDEGDTVGAFSSYHLGMGSFQFLPVPGRKYYATGILCENVPFTVDLPKALSKGFALKIIKQDTIDLQVGVVANDEAFEEYKGKELILKVKHCSKTYYTAKINLTIPQIAIRIPKEDLPEGVASIILYDASARPNCERLIFLNSKVKDINVSIVSDKPLYKTRDSVSLKIMVRDVNKKPINANLSLAVVDGTLFPEDLSNIKSYLMLQSEIKGPIENAKLYFDPANPNRLRQLDLLLLTQGWRDYVWRRIVDTTFILKYLPEAGITISGRVRQLFVDKPASNMNVTLFAPKSKTSKLFHTKTDTWGKYYFDGLELDGEQKLVLTSRNKRAKNGGWIQMDSLFKSSPVRFIILDNQLADTLEEAPKIRAVSQMRKEIKKKQSLKDTILLNEVVIEGPRHITLRDDVAMDFGYPTYSFDIQPSDYDYTDLTAFLLHKIPEATSDSSLSLAFYSNGKKIPPTIMVNRQEELLFNNFLNLSMDKINKVVVRHMMGASTKELFILSLDLKPEAFQSEFNIITNFINAYYQAKAFYSPKYPNGSESDYSDLRTTIYWEPNVTTDKNGEAIIKFYNGDLKTKIRAFAEGISEKGVPLVGETSYEIK